MAMSNKEKISGWFYFKITESGNLIGEFSSFDVMINSSNSADIEEAKGFIGTFNNVWLEGKSKLSMTLEIKPIEESANRFNLTWKQGNDTMPTYTGLGTIVDGILIGNYDNFPRPKEE